MESLQICALCGYSTTSAASFSRHQRTHCKVPGCAQCFATRPLLSQHLVTTHGYVKCQAPKCGRVFPERKSMQRHYAVHALAAPPSVTETLPASVKGLSWAEAEQLAKHTLDYLNSILGLVSSAPTRELGLQDLTTRVINGQASEADPFPLSLYLHAVEVVRYLPECPQLSEGLSVVQASSSTQSASPQPEASETNHRRPVSESPPALSDPQPAGLPLSDNALSLCCIEAPYCTRRFRTPKELLDHVEKMH